MENKKTEKKRIFSKLTVCVAALALVSCAFVGGTFARYTSGEFTTPGGVNVADWKIDIINEGEGFMELAPNKAEYDDSEGHGIRTFTVEGGKVLEIKNLGKVAAVLTLKVNTGAYVLQDKEGNPISLPTYSAEANNPEWEHVDEVTDIFTLNGLLVYSSTSTESLTGSTVGNVTTYSVPIASGQSVIIEVGQVVWTSDHKSDPQNAGSLGLYGDLRDTWLGENVSMVGYEMTWSVDQAENVPGTGAPNYNNP